MDKKKDTENILIGNNVNENGNFNKIITIFREYGSGGRFVAKVLGEKLGIKVYDAELIRLTAKETGFSLDYVQKNDQLKNNYYENDDSI